MRLMAFLLLVSSFSYADQRSSGVWCAPLLTHSNLMQGIPFSSSEEAGNNWSEAYLNLLNVVLEGIDEIATYAFGHGNRLLAKTQLLNNLVTSKIPINPLNELNANDSATSRNLTHFSPKLSTLTDSGQFEVVTENLTDADWAQIRQTAQQMLAQIQAVQTAQAIARPKTEQDFTDTPDINSETRLFRLIREERYDEALRLVEKPMITARYLNQISTHEKTALDFLVAKPNGSLRAWHDLYLAMTQKSAVLASHLLNWESSLYEAIKNGRLEEIDQLYQFSLKVMHPKARIKKLHFSWAIHLNHAALRHLLDLVKHTPNRQSIVEKLYLEYVGSNIPPFVFSILLDHLDLKTPFQNRTAFEHATFAHNHVLMRLIAKRADFDPAQYSQLSRKYIIEGSEVDEHPLVLETLVHLNIELDPNYSDGPGLMHIVAKARSSRVIEKLCELGVVFDKLDHDGKSPLDYLSSDQDQSNRKAIQACLDLRQKYAHVPLKDVFYTAYRDWVSETLHALDTFTSDLYLPSDRYLLKFNFLRQIVMNEESLATDKNIRRPLAATIRAVTPLAAPDENIPELTKGLIFSGLRLPEWQKVKFFAEMDRLRAQLSKPTPLHQPDQDGNLLLHRLIPTHSRLLKISIRNMIMHWALSADYLNHRNNKGETVLDLVAKNQEDGSKLLMDELKKQGAVYSNRLAELESEVRRRVAPVTPTPRPSAWQKFFDLLKKEKP